MENCLMLFSCRAATRRMLLLQIHLKRVGRNFLHGLDVPGDPAGAGSFFGLWRGRGEGPRRSVLGGGRVDAWPRSGQFV